jgi:hypothetical protein
LKGKEINVTNLIEIKIKSLKTMYFNVGTAESAPPPPLPMGVLSGLGQANLHSVEGCLVQPRLRLSTPGTDFKAKNAEATVTTSDQDNDQDYVTLKHSLLEKSKLYLENLWL